MDACTVAAGLWGGLGGDPAALDRLTVTGPAHVLPSVFPVTAAAAGAVSAATMAAAELWRVRGAPAKPVAVDTRHAALACLSERFTEVVGQERHDIWGPVSGTYATRDGWIRLHAVFRRHREAALRALGVSEADAVADRDVVRTAVAHWDAAALEETVYREGGCAGALRSIEQWRTSPQAAVVTAQPLVGLTPLGRSDGTHAVSGELDRPLRGMRILDLTRVIAGPVAARFLAAYGAEVLRIDAPTSDDEPQLVTDTVVGKRSASLDFHLDDDRRRFDALVRKADAVLCAYRPGALEELGYDPASLASLRPGLVVGVLSAYGGVGPWGTRRGFDSLVQMTTGLAEAGRHAAGAEMPVPLPCQLLDHATGYLLAAGVIAGLTRRTAASRGGGWLVQASLARTSCWLEGLGRSGSVDVDAPPTDLPEDLTVDLHGPLGHSRHIACPGCIVGAAPHYTTAPIPLGQDDPHWL
jgi:crotonobetainyl-CoA:carnitine CoA-transferase CaiB-like acyl-CoA transferase